jgi:hypothetical protein
MKNSIQRDLMRQYEAEKAQFSSYADFLNATADKSEEIRVFRDKVAKIKSTAKS